MKRTFHRNPKERGFAALAYALMILVILAFTGLAVDVGYLQWQRRLMQSATDAAAMGALRELEIGNSDLTAAGQNDAALNGFTNGQNGTTVTINNPPGSGSFAGKNTAVEAVIQRTYGTFFMRVLGTNNVTVAARSVGETTTTYGSIGGCIFALNPSIKAGLEVNGTSMDLSTSCNAVVESNDSAAYKMGSGVTWKFSDPGGHAHIAVVGGAQVTGQAGFQRINSSNAVYTNGNPTMVTGIVNPCDPFSCTTDTCLIKNLSTINAPTTTIRSASSVNWNKNSMPAGNSISPGVYCGGFTVGDTDDKTLTMQPGVYILAGGGMQFNSSARIAGTGVTIYNTSSSGWGCSGNSAYAPLQVDGQAQVNLSAPTNGPMEGMLFYMDRNITDTRWNQIVGGSSSKFDGALYFKHSNLKFAGKNSTTGYMILVADQIQITGSSTLGNNYTSLANPIPFAPGSTGGGLVQ
jgi:Flp pilus assembly protein TadG